MRPALLSIHAVDIAGGRPASGMQVDLLDRNADGHRLLKTGLTDTDGKLAFGADILPEAGLPYQLRVLLHVADYFNAAGWSGTPFVTVLPFDVVLQDASRDLHLPAKITPYGMSLFVTRSKRPPASPPSSPTVTTSRPTPRTPKARR